MTQQEGIVNGDALLKLGSIGFILGAILIGISGLLMPHAASPTSDLKEMLKPLGEYQSRTILASLLMAIGFWVVLCHPSGYTDRAGLGKLIASTSAS
jgi:hypothetical protein